MSLSYGSTVKVRATPNQRGPVLSVISSSASRPSYKGWASGGCRRAHAWALTRPGYFPPILLIRGRTTNQRYLVDNGNNMQSVKISIAIGDNVEDYSNKGIFNNICLMSNVSVILCVPRLMIKDNCYSIDTVTEPMQCNNCSTATMVADTNNFGASKRVYEDESQRINNINKLDSNIYSIVMVDSIQSNQMIGETPNYCIPVNINAITVQGISYSDPHSSSFNLNSNMASSAPRSTNKSDYAFKTSVCIINEEEISRERIMRQHRGSEKGANANKETCDKYDAIPRALTFHEMLEGVERERTMARYDADRWGAPRCLRLRGGGENSLSNASGWGSPPAANNNAAGNWGNSSNGQANAGGNPQQQWSGTGQRPPTSQPDMNSNKGNNNGAPAASAAPAAGWPGNAPGMPATPNNNAPPPNNNGTPNSTGGNSGGNNSPNGSANGNMPPGSTANTVANAANSLTSTTKIEQLNSMREALYSQDGWGGQHVNQDTNWDVPGSPEPGVKMDTPVGAPPPWKPNINNGTDLWEANLRNGGQPPSQPTPKTPWGHTPTTNIGGTWGEDDDAGDSTNMWSGPPPPQQWPGGPPQQPQHWSVAKKDDWGAWGEPHRPADPRFDAHRAPDPRPLPPDPRHDHLRAGGGGGGISGRLNGDMWGQHHPNAPAPNKMMPGGAVNQWGAQGPKDPTKGGWEEPSPPAARRSTGFEDGTSLWSGRPSAGGMVGGRGGAQGPPVQQRVPPVQTKPDAVWGQPPRNNNSWEDGHGPGWPEREAPGWPDAGNAGLGWPAPKPKPPGPGVGWPDEIGEWGGSKAPPSGPGKQITKEALWASKQFRILVEMGYKKEEVEAALRRCDMNTEEALELLSPMRSEAWRRSDDHFPPHHGLFPHQPPPSGLAAVSPAVAHKMLSQPPQPPHHQHHPPYNHPNSGGGGGGGQPSATQLRMLVQQIQMAVSAGYLNHQILNQPLAPQTLVLLNQLLQQIKVLQQLVTQHSLALSKNNSALANHCSVQITKAKQQISNLQNQIAAQQAIYVKQQTGGSELFSKQPSHDPLSQLQNNFSDMAIAKESQPGYGASSNQQSRLNQWKLPSLDKEVEGSEFSRAPGTAKSATSPQLNLALQPDSTWGRSGVGEAWGESGADVGDGKDAWPSHPAHQAVYDLVPEFEPGKPWKGNQMKNVEDDPAMTPGSVVRSPLSLAAIKDTDMLGAGSGGKSSPPAGERSLSSSTWSYPPPAAPAQPLKPPPDAWGGNKSRVPPPGLNKPWPQHQHNQRNISAWQSTWLLLKNLTAQIDGSTLKTLCMQHGPLQSFHLYLNQGIALARYSSREEANKAQTALNNCVLSNTTIFAESPSESEVQMILQHLGQGGGVGGASAWRSAPGKEQAWGFPSLWSESHDQRSTPSSLNSFLPPDLLSGDTI